MGISTDGYDCSAVLSDDGRYRYRLERSWGPGPRCAWVMLNPSIADATIDDPTIRRCVGFSKREGYGSLIVVNLYALRSPDPTALLTAEDPIGRDNRRHIADALCASTGPVIAGWGAFPGRMLRAGRPHPTPVWTLAAALGRPMVCLGTTKSGEPRHPLYLKTDQEMIPWQPQ